MVIITQRYENNRFCFDKKLFFLWYISIEEDYNILSHELISNYVLVFQIKRLEFR